MHGVATFLQTRRLRTLCGRGVQGRRDARNKARFVTVPGTGHLQSVLDGYKDRASRTLSRRSLPKIRMYPNMALAVHKGMTQQRGKGAALSLCTTQTCCKVPANAELQHSQGLANLSSSFLSNALLSELAQAAAHSSCCVALSQTAAFTPLLCCKDWTLQLRAFQQGRRSQCFRVSPLSALGC